MILLVSEKNFFAYFRVTFRSTTGIHKLISGFYSSGSLLNKNSFKNVVCFMKRKWTN